MPRGAMIPQPAPRVPVARADEFMLNLPEGVELDLRVPGILWFMRQRGLI